MKRKLVGILCILLLISFSVVALSEAVCTCNCCAQTQGEEKEETKVEEKELTPKERYSIWFDLAYTTIYSQYAHSTWFKAYQSDVSYLLNKDPLSWSSEDISNNINIEYYGIDGAKHMYLFLNTATESLQALKETHDLIEVPEDYNAIDALVLQVIETLLNYRDSIESQIQKNKTLKDFFTIETAPLTHEELKSAISMLELNVSLH